MRYTMKGSKRMVPCFDFRACLSTMLVVCTVSGKPAVSVREWEWETGDGIRNWTRYGERERRQSGEHLGTEYEWGRVGCVKWRVSCRLLFSGHWQGVTPRVESRISPPRQVPGPVYPRRSAHDRLRPFRTAENAHSIVIPGPFVSG